MLHHVNFKETQNCRQQGYEEESQSGIFVGDNDSWAHFRLNNSIEDFGILSVAALTIDDADENESAHVYPLEFLI